MQTPLSIRNELQLRCWDRRRIDRYCRSFAPEFHRQSFLGDRSCRYEDSRSTERRAFALQLQPPRSRSAPAYSSRTDSHHAREKLPAWDGARWRPSDPCLRQSLDSRDFGALSGKCQRQAGESLISLGVRTEGSDFRPMGTPNRVPRRFI
jgi:hypothetical protein